MYSEEKLRNEIETLKSIKEKTNIPVPDVIAFGKDDFFGLFMITNFINVTPLNTLLRADKLDEDEDEVLRGDISDEDLEKIYRQIANFLLQVWKLGRNLSAFADCIMLREISRCVVFGIYLTRGHIYIRRLGDYP